MVGEKGFEPCADIGSVDLVEVVYTANWRKTRSQVSEFGGANAHNLFLVALVVKEGTSRLA